MATSQLKRKYTVKRDVKDQRDWIYQPLQATVPAEVDLRVTCPPVYDQGELGSCTANAIAAHLDFNRKKENESFISPSRLFIYYNERSHDGDVAEDAGSTIRESVKTVKANGACPEAEWPYNVAQFTEKPSAKCYTDALSYEDLTYYRIPQQQFAMQERLAQGFPVVVGISVYESFESPKVASTGIVPMPGPGEELLGGHAVLCVGYQLINGALYWLMRNSWGSNWGKSGYFYLPVAYLLNPNLGGDYWSLDRVK